MTMVISIIPAIILLVSAAGYWRYDLSVLRWTVSGCAALLCVAGKRDSLLWPAILFAIIVIYNPLFPLHFPHQTRIMLDVVASMCLVAAGLLLF